jgi:hypothetical protein
MIWQRPEYPKPLPDEMIESQTVLANGATFTRLKPGIAMGAEDQDFWKQCGKRLNQSTKYLR